GRERRGGRREDQDRINEFGRLNARLHEVRDEVKKLTNLLEKIEDASTELMMGNGDRVMLRLGEAMFEATEDEATEFCEAEVERHQKTIDKLSEEETDILERQSGLNHYTNINHSKPFFPPNITHNTPKFFLHGTSNPIPGSSSFGVCFRCSN
ncbi:hypothetical protein ACHAW5_009947, partial [Stephanodiscus triporus]